MTGLRDTVFWYFSTAARFHESTMEFSLHVLIVILYPETNGKKGFHNVPFQCPKSTQNSDCGFFKKIRDIFDTSFVLSIPPLS